MIEKSTSFGAFFCPKFINDVTIFLPLCEKMIIMTQQYTFDKSDRLLNPNEFKKVFDQPIKKVHGEHCLLFVGKAQTNTARLGLAITKKKLKHAVDRNRLKRLTREHFRLAQSSLSPIDVVMIVKKGYDREFDIGAEVAEIFRKIKQIYPSN